MRRPRVSAGVLGWMLAGAVSLAHTTGADPQPLRPGDTSSPRATLSDFLRNANELAEVYRRDGLEAALASPARARALDAFDLSSAEYRDIHAQPVTPSPILLLHEILNRIELPHPDEIPGDAEVARGGVDRWTIPGTRIAIGRVGSGPRAGEYLVTADTVSQLEAYHALIAHLPLRAGAVPGIQDDVARDDRAGLTPGRQVRNRLKPVDTSSPRTVLRGFVESIDRAHAIVRGADAALRADPPAMSRAEALEAERSAETLLLRAVHLLDLEAIPEAHREHAGLELALALKEVLDRVGVPPWTSVPDGVAVAEHRRQPGALPFRWEVPNTPIEIAPALEGERSGEFRFSARTVAAIKDHYDQVRDLPYRPGASQGFYEDYISTPGYLVAGASPLGALVDRLPASLKTLVHGQTLWQWIGLALCVLATTLVAVAGARLVWRSARRLGSPRGDWVRLLVPAGIAALVSAVRDFIDNGLNITGGVLEAVTVSAELVVYVSIAWVVLDGVKALAELAVTSPRFPTEGIDRSLFRVGARIAGFLLGAWIVIAGLRSLGADVVPLLAGLGIGGLAVALAAQTTLANFIGSLTLFANRTVRVGDVCRYGDQLGTVEEIGLHSTWIRTPERTVVSIPNAEFAQLKLDNLAKRDRRLLKKLLSLRSETTPAQLRDVLGRLRALLAAHPMVVQPARVRFVDYGVYSKDVEVFAYLQCRSDEDFLAIQEDILLQVEDAVSGAGARFAFPSQVSYLASDPALGSDPGRDAAVMPPRA